MPVEPTFDFLDCFSQFHENDKKVMQNPNITKHKKKSLDFISAHGQKITMFICFTGVNIIKL